MFSKSFLIAALERAIKTAAQSALLVLGAEQINALNADWADVAGFALGGFALSLLTSAASSGIGSPGPSAANETVEPEGEQRILGKA